MLVINQHPSMAVSGIIGYIQIGVSLEIIGIGEFVLKKESVYLPDLLFNMAMVVPPAKTGPFDGEFIELCVINLQLQQVRYGLLIKANLLFLVSEVIGLHKVFDRINGLLDS